MAQHSWPELRLNDPKSFTKEYAEALDAQDPLRQLREDFVIPTRAGLKRKRLGTDAGTVEVSETINSLLPENDLTYPATYLCGNSLGLQPRRTQEYIRKYLDTWANKGVYGHFQPLEDAVSKPWVDIDEDAKVESAKIVGAQPEEVAVMQTLTANLHLLMASFYRPTKDRYKIMIEGKAFPSIQYYSGQFLDIPTITAYAQARDIVVAWDLAHAVGNVPLQLHDWNVDFAAWCNYKYMNGGPGVIGGLFVHSRHTAVNTTSSTTDQPGYRPRLSGWWGHDKSTRFQMRSTFVPMPGAAGFQLSNPSALDTTALLASLSVFAQTSVADLRAKSLRLTAYLEHLLFTTRTASDAEDGSSRLYSLITPRAPEERGAQLSLLLKPGLLERVMEALEHEGVVVDERRPDVVRVAPVPLYNGFADVWRFVDVFGRACKKAAAAAAAVEK
ncbi:Kynureninase (L-kynurenine hydrolase) [Diplodia intermedia]|uniref:Kynureninase n=1 Tax=Diplodia intermedia TaxID=856260 RepID=A0ABR3U2Z9_9PEZI